MATYLDTATLKDLLVIPGSYVDEVELMEPGWVEKQLDYWSRWIDGRLRKRYATPFPAFDDPEPTPVAVQGWLAQLVAPRVMLRRGVDQNDAQFDTVREDAETAKAEIAEAANGDTGLWDLPKRTGSTEGGPSKGGPLAYSEASPYAHTDVQRETAYHEDRNGRGTSHG